MSLAIVTHLRPRKRKARTLALMERAIHIVRTRLYVRMALRHYFNRERQQRAETLARLARLCLLIDQEKNARARHD